jgi:hypothetical protein
VFRIPSLFQYFLPDFRDSASSLARDVDEEIFKPIKSTMIKIYGDGAPYRPSSSLVQFYEEEPEHPNMDRDVLLKEIEDPTPVQPKVEIVKTTALETAEEVKELNDLEKRVEAKVDMVKANPAPAVKFTPVNFTAPAPKPAAPIAEAPIQKMVTPESPNQNSLERLASLKLSKTFVMPKGGNNSFTLDKGKEGMGSEINKPLRPLDTSPLEKVEEKIPSTSSQSAVEKAEPDPKPYIPPAPKQYSVDPYREPIN